MCFIFIEGGGTDLVVHEVGQGGLLQLQLERRSVVVDSCSHQQQAGCRRVPEVPSLP